MRRLLFAALLTSAPAEAATLVKDRIPMALHVVGPASFDVPADLIRERADAMLRVRTRLSVSPVEALSIPRAQLEACGISTNLGCWVAAVRPEDVRRRAGSIVPADLALPSATPPYLMVVTVHSGERGRLAVLIIDLDRAVRAYDHVSTSDEGWKERVEALMYQDAVHSDFAEIDVTDPAALDAFFTKLFDTKMRGVFEGASHWRENGAVEIDTPQAGLTIGIDGEPAGVTAAGKTRVDGVPIGERTIALTDPNGLVQHEPVPLSVERGRAALLVPTLSSGPSSVPTIRAVTLWTGVAVAAAVAAMFAYAFAAPQDGHDLRVCPGGVCPDSDRRFATFSGAPGGVPIAPIAVGLFGAGLGWSLGALIFGEEHELPWIAWLTGVGLGGAALAGTWAAD
jgi:hypothetical protein